MSSKRGRKRNDNLPPNRARDVQRAFRARRAAHLVALEERVAELEEENSCLRQALHLPQAIRVPLGKGPTGKDKPKPFDPTVASGTSPLQILLSSRESSTDSPTSDEDDQADSVSRSAIQDIQNGTGVWGQAIVMQDEVPSYAPVSAPPTMSTKGLPYSPTYSRSSSLTSMYMYPTSFEQQQQQPQRSYSYSSPTQPSPYEQQPRDVSTITVGYPPPRRGTSDYSSLHGGYHATLPPSQTPTGIRLPSPPRALQEQHPSIHELHSHHSQHDPHVHHRPAYTSDGRIISS
ncbi:DNA helicase [Mycena kentingensis (nom. inval.)]|nr:DNA helicase [Mycena kentingensis (nom. inval.)]